MFVKLLARIFLIPKEKSTFYKYLQFSCFLLDRDLSITTEGYTLEMKTHKIHFPIYIESFEETLKCQTCELFRKVKTRKKKNVVFLCPFCLS